MNAISFFAGAGGLDLGIEKAGFNIRLCVELEKKFCETLTLNNHKNVVNGDIMEFDKEKISNLLGNDENGQPLINNIDLMIGGSPCQSFSTAGRRQAFDDPRGGAMLKYVNLINEIQPKAFLLENVKGLLSAALNHVTLQERADRRANGQNEYELDELPGSALEYLLSQIQNYNVVYRVLNSADYGVPQKRERVFFIGIRKDLNREFVFPEPTHSKDGSSDGLLPWVTFRSVYEELEKLEIEHNYEEYRPERLRYMEMVPKGGGYWRHLPEEVQAEAMGGAYKSGGGKVGFYRRIYIDQPAPTVLTSPTQKSTNLGHPMYDRPLSIEEYKLIQGFPLDYKINGSIKDQYKQLGNAVPVKVAKILGESIYNQLKEK